MKVMVTFLKRNVHSLLYSVPLTLKQASVDPSLCQKLLDIQRYVCLSLLWRHCSFLLDSGVHKILILSYRSLFPKSSGSYIIKTHCPPNSNSLGVLSPFADPQFGKSVVSPRTFLKVREFLWCNCSAVCGFLLNSALVGLN